MIDIWFIRATLDNNIIPKSYPVKKLSHKYKNQNQQKLTIRIFHGSVQGQENQSEGQGFAVKKLSHQYKINKSWL